MLANFLWMFIGVTSPQSIDVDMATVPVQPPAVHRTSSPDRSADRATARTSVRSIRARAERRAAERLADKEKRDRPYVSEDFGFRMTVPKDWTLHEVAQKIRYTDVDQSASETRVAVMSFGDTKLTELSTDAPYLPAFEHSAPLIAGYTDVNTLSLFVEELSAPVPSLAKIDEAYTENLILFGYEDTIVCDCDKRLGGKKTTLAYSYPTEDTVLVQTWTVIGSRVYLLNMLSDFEHYDAMYEGMMNMIQSFESR